MTYRDSPENAVRRAIIKRYLAEQPGGLSSERTGFDNEVFDPPADNMPWARLVVRQGTREQINIGRPGNRRFLVTGSVIAQVFTLADTGLAQADEICRTILDLFDVTTRQALRVTPLGGANFGAFRVKFQAATRREGGADGRWERNVVEAPFTYEERESWAS